ncbi:hypothetical protein ENBRE01_2003 [Enteropsectra breve]|nr:hypothetical protein ENBRE01_2003 [Enteropsectra breve]
MSEAAPISFYNLLYAVDGYIPMMYNNLQMGVIAGALVSIAFAYLHKYCLNALSTVICKKNLSKNLTYQSIAGSIHPVLSIVTIVLVIITYLQSLAKSIQKYSYVNLEVAKNWDRKHELLYLIPLLVTICAVIFAADRTFFILSKTMSILFPFEFITMFIPALALGKLCYEKTKFFDLAQLRRRWLDNFAMQMNNAHGPYFYLFEHYASTIRSPTFIGNELFCLLSAEWMYAFAEGSLRPVVPSKCGRIAYMYQYSTAIPLIKELWKIVPYMLIRILQNINYCFLIGGCLGPFIIAVYNLNAAFMQIFCFKNKRASRILSFGLLCFLTAWLYLPRYFLLKLRLENVDILYAKFILYIGISRFSRSTFFVTLIPFFLLTYAFPCAFKMTTCKRHSSEFVIAGVVMLMCCSMFVMHCFFPNLF